MNNSKNCEGFGNEPLTPAVGGKAVAADEASQTESNQKAARPNETQIGVVSDCQGALQAQENECVASNDATSIEHSIELSMFSAGETPELHDIQDSAASLDGDFTKPASYSEKVRAKARLVGFLTGVVAITGLAFFLMERNTTETAKRESAAFHRATEDEHEKRWPAAAAEYKALAGGHGAIAVQSGKDLTRLSALLEKENSLKQDIEQARMAKSYDQAEVLLTQLADLHGDFEEQALSEKNEVEQEAQSYLALGSEKDEAPSVRAARLVDKRNKRKLAAAKPAVPTQKDSSCQAIGK